MAAPALTLAALLAACGEQAETMTPTTRTVVITAASAVARTVEVIEESIGYVETETAPMVAAEVGGRLLGVYVDVGAGVEAGTVLARVDPQDYRNELRSARGEVARLEALMANQQRLVERFRSLGRDRFVSETALDEAEANLKALREQLETATARRDIAARNYQKATVVAPVEGVIERRLVSEGTYVQQGQALFQIATRQLLRVHLPFPETVIGRLAPGLKVYLTTPTAPQRTVTGTIADLKPMVGTGNRAGEAIVNVQNPGGWAPGASVTGRVVLEERASVVVPDVAVVLRPVGRVVYVLDEAGGRVTQRKVETGERLGQEIEILRGVSAGERVAADGAHYLADKAAVRVREDGA